MNLLSGNLGNGITFWRSGSNGFLAHVSENGTISIYEKISKKEKLEIEEYANKKAHELREQNISK